MIRKILLAGASLLVAGGLAACSQAPAETGPATATPNPALGLNATGVTGQLQGTNGGMRTNENAPAMPPLNETAPAQRNSTISQ